MPERLKNYMLELYIVISFTVFTKQINIFITWTPISYTKDWIKANNVNNLSNEIEWTVSS